MVAATVVVVGLALQSELRQLLLLASAVIICIKNAVHRLKILTILSKKALERI